jgi:ornithine cyclodeaminase/alanine dehydrogenase-like protein (mu-crystallin family)
LVLATTSKDPVCSPGTSPPQLIVSLGADTDFQRELDPAWASRASLFVETLDSVRYGDLRSWLAAGLISEDQLTDLFSLLNKDVVLDDSGKTRIFVSTGTALFDNIAISYLLSR